jgi:hypothetical protein
MNAYWLKLRDDRRGLGFGITARDRDDAMTLLARASTALTGKPADATMIETLIETWREIDVADELDQNHVVPNMGMLLRRGVWFPDMPEIQ